MISNRGTMEELALPLFLTALPLTIMGVLLPMYTSALGLKPLQITGLFSVLSLGFVIIRLLIGYITDKIGRKPIFVFGILFYIAAYYIYSIARSISFIYIARSLQSIAAALVGISSYSIIADMNTRTNAHNFGKISSYSDKGGLLGIILCFYILNTPKLVDGWSRLFSVCTYAAIVAIIYSLIFIKNTKIKKENVTNISLSLNKRKIILFYLFICIFTSLVSAIFVLYLQNRFDSDLLQIGIAFIFPTIVTSFASPTLGKISDNIGCNKAVVISLCMMFVSLLMLPFMNSIYLFGAVWTIYCIGFSLINITIDGMFVVDIARESRGTAISKYSIGGRIGSIIGPLLGGFAFQTINSSVPFFVSAFGFLMLLILSLKWFPVVAMEKEQ